MTKTEVASLLTTLKPKYQEGFEILGFFGSYARDEAKADSDIDILYTIKDMNAYLARYNSWECVNHIVETKAKLEQDFDAKVDFVDIETLNPIGKKYILKDAVYV